MASSPSSRPSLSGWILGKSRVEPTSSVDDLDVANERAVKKSFQDGWLSNYKDEAANTG